MRARSLRIFGLWTLLGLMSSVQVYFAHLRLGSNTFTLFEAFGSGLAFWYLWAAATPLVAFLGRRFQVDRANFSRHFVIHLGASLDFALLHLLAVVGVQNLLHVVAGQPYDFLKGLIDDFALLFHWEVLIYWAILSIQHALHYHGVAEEARSGAAAGARAEPVTSPVERLLVADTGRSFFVRTADVEWIEAAKNYVRLHDNGRTHVVRTTLNALEARLDRTRFRRVSRSALVNLDRVREIQPWFHGDAIVILQSGAQVTLSRRYRSNLLETSRSSQV
jgi:LytTr DNA-binding domain-containing protein